VPGDHLEQIGRAYAEAGDTARAYGYLLQACEARQRTHSREAVNRATALKVWQERERARLESDYLRRLAEAERSRAEVLERTAATLEALGAIGQEITAHLRASAVVESIQRHVHALLQADYLAIYMLDEAGAGLQPVLGIEAGAPAPLRYVPLDSGQSLAARCVRERRVIVVDDVPGDDSPGDGSPGDDASLEESALIPGTLETVSLMFAPLAADNRILGVMSIQSVRPHVYGEREQSIFRTLCAYGAIALDNARAYQQLHAARATLLQKNTELEQAYVRLAEQSITDPLTGLRNRRFLTGQMEHDVALTLRRYDEYLRHGGARPAEHDFVLFLIDLDHFKQVNDTYGHAAGDAVLMQLRERLQRVFRDSDYLVRWGGEEFLIVARGANRDDALTLAERARASVSSAPFEIAPGQWLERTCSIGFASFPFAPQAPHWLAWGQVVELADRALYMAKNMGRDRSVGLVAGEVPPVEMGFVELVARLEECIAAGQIMPAWRRDE